MKPHLFHCYLLICGVILSLHGGCRTQKPMTDLPDSIPPGPQIKFDTLVIDIGKVGQGAKTIKEVKFTNTGSSMLNILNIEQCCGVATKLEKNEYAPGETGILQVAYQATAHTGPFEGHVVITSNNGTDPNTTLTVKAEVIPKIIFTPDILKLFVDEENAACPELIITSLDNQPFSISAIRSTADCITAEYNPSATAAKFVLKPIVDMEKIQKTRRGTIDFILTHPEDKSGSVMFHVLPKYSLDPQMLLLYNAKENVPIPKTINVITNDDKEFQIESMTSKEHTIQVVENNKTENGYRLSIEITPPAKGNQIRFTDVLYIKIQDGEILEITCTAYYARG